MCIFSIPLLDPKSLLIVYNTILFFITISWLLNFFKSSVILLLVSSSKISLYVFLVISSKYWFSKFIVSDNLFKVFIIFGFNSFSIYGINWFLILFLVYMFWKFVWSIRGFNFSSIQYCSISFLVQCINGRINLFSLLACIPFSPWCPASSYHIH